MELLVRIVGIITPVLLIGAAGYGYGRLRKPDMTWVNRINTELLFPLLIFSAMSSKEFHIVEFLPLIGGQILVVLGCGVLALGVARWRGYNPRAFLPTIMFANTANMGLPLTLFAFGQAMLPAAVALFMIISLLHFTLGIRICNPKASLRGIVQAPVLWAAVLGVVMSLFGWTLPAWLATSARMLGDATIPMGLFSLGVGFSCFDLSRWRIGLVGAVLRPVSGLLIAWPLAHLLQLSPPMQGVLLLYAALPPAVMNYIFAEQYQQDAALVSAVVVSGTLASLMFVPIALYLGMA